MTVACVLITYLPIKYEQLRYPELKGKALLVVSEASGRKYVYDRSPEARGTTKGMPLEHAQAKCPQAHRLQADTEAYGNFWERVLDSLEGRSPVVENADLGLAYVDLKGLEGMYGTEANLVKAISSAVPSPYSPRVGVAANKFLAYVAAVHAEPDRASKVEGEVTLYLAPLHISILPTAHSIKEKLIGFGLERVGDIARLSIGAMQAEFGPEGAKLWRLSHGIDDTQLTARCHKNVVEACSELPAPTAIINTMMIGVENLLHQAFSTSEMKGKYARTVTIEARITDMPAWVRKFVFREPMGDPRLAMKLLNMKMEDMALPGPVESVSVMLTDLTGESGKQESLFYKIRRQEQLDEEIHQLEARLGEKPPIYLIREVEPWSRIPERRMALVPYAR
ncbi:MAG: hypothetical protein EXR59_05335 [Dehalococcoidia bacterium]|nr:hypothetical protein [Dehalococcoidia bacterium]